MKVCENCREEFEVKDLTEVDGEFYCSGCFDEEFDTCSDCNAHILKDNLTKADGELVCEKCLEDSYEWCENCEEYRYRDDGTVVDVNFYCSDCFDGLFYTCVDCGRYVLQDSSYYLDHTDHIYCESCYYDNTFCCDSCGNRRHVYDSHSDCNITICGGCYEDDYFYCEECDSLTHYENGSNGLCDDCGGGRRSSVIEDYSYRPSPRFHVLNDDNDNHIFMGIELEVDEGSFNEVEDLHSLMNNDYDYCYFKYDGSLYNGFEIVTHPATLEFHSKVGWPEFMDKLIKMGFKSHDAGTCGLHIHVGRTAFGTSTKEQDINITKVLYFYERFWNEIVRLSRRKQSQTDRWASLQRFNHEPDKYIKTAKGDRYKAVNLQNINTVEFRVFRGTLMYDTFIATLQFTRELVRITKELDLEKLVNINWSEFVDMLDPKYNELLQYIGKRNIQILEKPKYKLTTIEKPIYKDIAVSSNHIVALKTDGSIEAWGNDCYGKVTTNPTSSNYVKVTAAENFSAALNKAGDVIVWGNLINFSGCVIEYIKGVSDISARGYNLMILDGEGYIKMFGDEEYAKLAPTDKGFIGVSAGHSTFAALRGDGSIVLWGEDAYGIISNAPTGKDFVKVCIGSNNGIALRKDGTIAAWGRDNAYQVTDAMSTQETYVDIACGNGHIVGLTKKGKIVVWGSNSYTQIMCKPSGDDFTKVVSGYYTVTALDKYGTLTTWGKDAYNIVTETPSKEDKIILLAI